MDILLYFLLRRLFCEVRAEADLLRLRKGLFLRRESLVKLSCVLCADITATPAMRLIGARKITLTTLSGKYSFFLARRETPEFSGGCAIRPSALSVLYGAFIDTRALGGAAAGAYTLWRVGRFFGSEYVSGVLAAVSDTAEELSRLLAFLHVAVPRFTAAAAVFTAFAWLGAFAVKLTKLSRFRVSAGGGRVVMTHGTVTLYERIIPLAAHCVFYSCDTVTTLLFGAAPVYFAGEMAFPPIKRSRMTALARGVFGVSLPKNTLHPPKRAVLGYAAVPLWWAAGLSAAALLCAAITPQLPLDAALLRSLLWCAAAGSAWLAAAYALYAGRAELSLESPCSVISTRRRARLYTAFFRQEAAVSRAVLQNPFQRKNGLCDIVVYARGANRMRFRLARRAAVQPLSGSCR